MWCDACWKSGGKPASSSWDKQGKTVKERANVGEICKWRKKKVRVGSGYQW